MSWNVWNRPSGSFMVDMGSHQTLWSLPFPNFTWHSGTWPCTMTPSIDLTLHQFANLLPNWTWLPILTLLPIFLGFHRTLQRVRLAYRGRLLLRTPGPVPFGTCICSYVETILSWTCHVYGPFEFRTSFGTSILFPIVKFPWLSGDVPRLPSYGIYILQLVRFAKCCTSVLDFHSKISQLIQNCGHRVIDIELLSKFGDISFQEYFFVSKGISQI